MKKSISVEEALGVTIQLMKGVQEEKDKLKAENERLKVGQIKKCWNCGEASADDKGMDIYMENVRLKETLNNLAKVPTQPYEKAMAQRIAQLEGVIRSFVNAWEDHQKTKFKNDGSHLQADITLNACIAEAWEALVNP